MTSQHTAITLTILGSGTCAPSAQRSSCAALIEIGDEKLLFDCGPGTISRLLSAGVRISEITAICLSHFHPDHSGELASFLFSLNHGIREKRTTPLVLVGGAGVWDFMVRMNALYGKWVEPSCGVKVIEMAAKPDERQFDGFTLRTAPMNHNPESIAFRVEGAGRSLVYSGDTDECEALVDLAMDTDLLLCESAMPDELKVPGHLTPSLAGTIARRARAQMLVLTHFYPECDAADLKAQCRATYDGHLLLAEDLTRIDL